MRRLVIGTIIFIGTVSAAWAEDRPSMPAAEPPVIPVGLDAYRQWERWPVERIGVRAYMRSTYDRRGGNERASSPLGSRPAYGISPGPTPTPQFVFGRPLRIKQSIAKARKCEIAKY